MPGTGKPALRAAQPRKSTGAPKVSATPCFKSCPDGMKEASRLDIGLVGGGGGVSGCTLKPGAWLGSGGAQGFVSIPNGDAIGRGRLLGRS